MMEEIAEPFHVEYHSNNQSESSGSAFTVSDTTPIIKFVKTGDSLGTSDSFHSGKLYTLRKELAAWKMRKFKDSHCSCSFQSGWVRNTLWTLLVIGLIGLAALIGYFTGPNSPGRQVFTVYLRLNNGSTLQHIITFRNHLVTIAVPRQGNIVNMKNVIDFQKAISVYSVPAMRLCLVRPVNGTLTPSYQTMKNAVINSAKRPEGLRMFPATITGWQSRTITEKERQLMSSIENTEIRHCLESDFTTLFLEYTGNNMTINKSTKGKRTEELEQEILRIYDAFNIEGHIALDSFVGGENRRTRRKPRTFGNISNKTCTLVYLPSFGTELQTNGTIPTLELIVSSIDIVQTNQCSNTTAGTHITSSSTEPNNASTVTVPSATKMSGTTPKVNATTSSNLPAANTNSTSTQNSVIFSTQNPTTPG